MKTTTHQGTITKANLGADPVLVAIVAERESVKAALKQTALYPLIAANLAASNAWVANDTPETRAALRDADAQLEEGTLADADSAHLFARLTSLTLQLRNHRTALGLN